MFLKTYRRTSYSSDDTFDIRTLSWRNPRDIPDDTLRQLISILVGIERTDPDEDHCMYHSSNNI